MIAAFAFGAGWQVNGWRAGAAAATVLREERARLDAQGAMYATLAGRYETLRATLETAQRARQPEVQRVLANPSHRADCVDADGLRILTDAVRAGNAARGATSALPAPP